MENHTLKVEEEWSMGIFSKLFKSTCSFCKKKKSNLTSYKDDHGVKIKVCLQCKEYAERRAFRRI